MRIVRFVAVVLFSATFAHAEDWPHWRGPLGSGLSPERNLPVRWSATENIAWRTALPGKGVSSPVVSGDRVFVTSQKGRGRRRDGNHPSLVQGADAATAGERTLAGLEAGSAVADNVVFVLSAYQASTGKALWHLEVPAEGDLQPVHDKHNLATPSPVTNGRIVTAWFGTGQVAAADMTGKLLWKRHLGAEYSPFVINWGHSSSPTMFEDTVVLLCYHEKASYLIALEAATGKTKWKVDRPGPAHSYSTPIIVQGEGGPEMIVNTSQGLEAYNPRTGGLLWRAPEENRFPVPVPTYHEGTVYTTRGYRSSPYLAVRLGGRGDVSSSHVEWKVPTGGPYISSLVYYDGLLYMASELGIVTCIDAKTGERVWRERLGGIFTASPVAGDGKIYIVSETGETIVLKAGRTLEVLSRNRLDDFLVASPAISGGRIFLRGDDDLIAIGS
jgi:outer membrane protein assembly factor BamB